MLKCRFSKYISYIIVICSLVLISFSGCGKDSRIILTTGFDEDELFRIDGLSCSRAEFMVYLTNIQDQYEIAFGKKIWDADTGEMIDDIEYHQKRDNRLLDGLDFLKIDFRNLNIVFYLY